MALSPLAATFALAAALGVAAGVGGYTFVYARGGSYLTDDPAACANCHVMRAEYDGWRKSNHHAATVCNDCHTPAGLVTQWATKARNGWHHSFAFTTGEFAEPIRIGARNLEIAEQACRKCHAEMVHAIEPGGDPVRCTRCHREAGHAR